MSVDKNKIEVSFVEYLRITIGCTIICKQFLQIMYIVHRPSYYNFDIRVDTRAWLSLHGL